MIRSLRDELDHNGAIHEERLQKEAQLKSMEFNQLQDTIKELRSKIQNDN